MLAGMRICRIARSTARRVAERFARRQIERDRGRDERSLVVDRERRVARPEAVNAESGTIVSLLVLTAGAGDALPLPVVGQRIGRGVARRSVAAIAGAGVAQPVPLLDGCRAARCHRVGRCVPLAVPPEVLT